MHATRTSIRRWAWLVSLTILLAAMLPSVSQAMLAKNGATFAEICSATGAKFVLVSLDAASLSSIDDHAPSDTPTMASMDCPYCALHHGAPALPPAPALWQPPDALSFERPALFFSAPRPLFAWAAARARAPPIAA